VKKHTHLNDHDLEHLLVTLETSLMVNNRSQFFLWAQGALQGFIPHETLFCAFGDIGRMRFKFETFSRGLLPTQIEQNVGDPVNGLLPRIVDDWLRGGCVPRRLSSDCDDQVGRRQLLADLKRCDCGHVVAHGVKETPGTGGSFFVFVRQPNPPAARDVYLLELLMPSLHMALYRVLASGDSEKTDEDGAVTLLSKREMQVLYWVKNGKTNQEIGQILDITPPTVKNHVQNIMRKLNVTNRAQAVGKSATLRLLVAGESG
jgi:transcriptional regulator EpsA